MEEKLKSLKKRLTFMSRRVILCKRSEKGTEKTAKRTLKKVKKNG
ncbi:MAG: hypothetical protein Q4A04_09190 [Eubacteriales bacterium]|nr:hypothetical protein [Eubacteriales bacterium]